MSETRKLKTVLFADIAGYTSLMQEDEKNALSLLNQFKEVLEENVLNYEGEITQYFGDGCLLTFDSGTKGTECAIALQVSFQNKNIPVRIGMHLGDVIFKNNNAFGDGVNIASRIESLGIPGVILLSKAVRDQIKNKSEFHLVSLGEFDFKNVEEAMEVYAIANRGLVVPRRSEMKGKLKQKPIGKKIGKNLAIYLGSAWVVMEAFNFFIEHYNLEPLLLDILIIFLVFGLFSSITFSFFKGRWNKKAVILQMVIGLLAIFSTGYFIMNPLKLNPRSLRFITLKNNKSPLRNLSSIAVLPIQNNLPNNQNDYLLAGLHDGIITELGKLNKLKTISRTSTLSYAESSKRLKQIGRELGVNSILESSLSPSSNGYVYRTRLLDTKTEELMWSSEFKIQVSELPKLFDEISQMVAIKLNPGAIEDVRVHEDINPEAYKEVLKGNYLLQKFSKKDLEQSIIHYKKAIELDSTNIEGYLGVAGSWIYMQQIGVVDPKIARPNIFYYGEKAVEIDPDHWLTLGYLSYKAFSIDYNYEKGIQLTKKSLELNPNNSANRSALAHLYMQVNEWEKAWEQMWYAKEIDPLNPQVLAFEAIMYMNENKYLSAVKLIEKLSLIDEESDFVKLTNVVKNRDLGNDKEAIESMKKLYLDATIDPVTLNKFIDREYEKTKDINLTWITLLRYLQKIDYQKYYPSNTARVLYSLIPPGYDDDLFFECLSQMANDRDPNMPYYARKDGNPLQKDPRYAKIMKNIKLW